MSVIAVWPEIEGAVSYNVYRSPTGDTGTYVLQGNVKPNVYNDPTGDETLFYQVIAVDVYGAEGETYQVDHLYTPETTSGAVTTCQLFGNILDVNGHPDPEIEVRVELACGTTPQTVQNAGMTTDTLIKTTNTDGYFEFHLVRGAVVTLFIPDMKYRKQFAVPDQATLDFKDIVGVDKKIENPF